MGNMRRFVKDNTADLNSVCELGAGRFSNFPLYQCPIKIGIELIPDYINNRTVGNQFITKAILGDATKFEELLDEDVDAFAIIDFIEHIEKDVAIDLLKRLQARSRRIFIFVPYGTHEQTGEDSFGFADKNLENILNQSGNANAAMDAQRHKSKWYVEDLASLGFVVDHDTNHHSPKQLKIDAYLLGDDGGSVMWAVWNKK